jgi:ABC-type phosphate transport system substrate-binding protein
VVVQWLRSLLDFLGAGNLVLAIIGLLLTPFVDRLLIRRHRLSFRVLYNSKIGLDAGPLHEDGPGNSPQLLRLARLLDQLSMVVIRVRNNGSYDIEPDDFERPLSFTFGRRVVWNARISEAGSPEERARLRANLQFFGHDAGAVDGPAARDNLRTVRDRLMQRMTRTFGGVPATTLTEDVAEPSWHGVRLDRLALKRRQKFKLVVVLREPDAGNGATSGTGTSKEYSYSGKLRDNGLIKRESDDRHLSRLQQVTGGLAALLTVLLVLALVFAPPPADSTVGCASGDLRIVGSSVFMPALRDLAADYMAKCGHAHLDAAATGSITGVQQVAALEPGRAGDLMAAADGKQKVSAVVYAAQLAIVVYEVVVNSSTGIHALTTAELRGIYDGTYTDWNQLRGGTSLPIRIIGRGGESGSRELFESQLLGGAAEPELTSNDCVIRDRQPRSRIIRCERNDNSAAVQAISHTDGAIGYADRASIAAARATGDLVAVVVDGKVFDTGTGTDSGDQFWTVEYLYFRAEPTPGTLAAKFLEFLRTNDRAQIRLKDAGYLPCTTADGVPRDLCNRR